MVIKVQPNKTQNYSTKLWIHLSKLHPGLLQLVLAETAVMSEARRREMG